MSASPLWSPSPRQIATANLTRFLLRAERQTGRVFESYDALWRWSINDPAAFWTLVWDEAGVIADAARGPVLVDETAMPGARFFPEARLNFAENLLRTDLRQDDDTALIFYGEDKVRRALTFGALRAEVSRMQQFLRDQGVVAGDRVAGFMPNMPEAIIAMLAAVSLGAVWSSASPDFGVQGVLDRFGQIEPKVVFAPDGYWYNGKAVDVRDKVAEFTRQLPSCRKVVIVPYLTESPDISAIGQSVTWPLAVAAHAPRAVEYERQPFNHPLYILYSSGTTGVPKCIIHGAGGTLLQHLKEQILHSDIKPGDRLFYFTTCGWMMWNWLTSGLAAGATLLLFDGSPFALGGHILWQMAEAERCTHFGTSAKYIDALKKAELYPAEYRLDDLRVLFSTGSPLAPESFDYVYEAIKKDVCLASISGGTDIVSCFMLGNPILPVWRGEIQCRGLGMAVAAFDDEARPLPEGTGERGELVCTRPFPSMPIGFGNDPDGAKYRAAYFERYPGVWCHGDMIEITEHGGLVVYGRSDAVLNPGGVRIGTAEIYRQVERLPEVVESIVIGQDWPPGTYGDVRVVLFVKLQDGLVLDDALAARISQTIRDNTTPRHVPARILQVPDIPRTKSGKIVELAVRSVVHGQPVKNVASLANPEALDHFSNRSELLT